MGQEKCKYQTLAEVNTAFTSGEIPDGSMVVIDNDEVSLYGPPNLSDAETGCLWRGGTPREVLAEALDLFGIPWDRA